MPPYFYSSVYILAAFAISLLYPYVTSVGVYVGAGVYIGAGAACAGIGAVYAGVKG